MALGLELLQAKLQVLHRSHQKHWRRVQGSRQYLPAASPYVACNLLFLCTGITQLISPYLLIEQVISCGHIESVSGACDFGKLSGRASRIALGSSVSHTHTLLHRHCCIDTWELLTARLPAIQLLCQFLPAHVKVTTCGHVQSSCMCPCPPAVHLMAPGPLCGPRGHNTIAKQLRIQCSKRSRWCASSKTFMSARRLRCFGRLTNQP